MVPPTTTSSYSWMVFSVTMAFLSSSVSSVRHTATPFTEVLVNTCTNSSRSHRFTYTHFTFSVTWVVTFQFSSVVVVSQSKNRRAFSSTRIPEYVRTLI